MSNFFAALDDSENEGKAPAPAVAKKKAAPKKTVVEPSKVAQRPPKKEDRHTKGGRGSRQPARDGKRTHDRRSGTGRGREGKKGGGGGHNWGSNQNDAKKAEGPVKEGEEAANTPEAEEATETEDVEKTEEAAPEPVEDKTMSYEDYLAQKARPDSQAFKQLESREVDNEFAGKAAAKKEEGEGFMQMGGGKQLKKKGTGKKEKETLVLDFKIKKEGGDDRRDGRRDGDRRDGGRRDGGGRRDSGGRNRDGRRDGGGRDRDGRRDNRGGNRSGGGGRGGGGRGKRIDTNDANAFPSL